MEKYSSFRVSGTLQRARYVLNSNKGSRNWHTGVHDLILGAISSAVLMDSLAQKPFLPPVAAAGGSTTAAKALYPIRLLVAVVRTALVLLLALIYAILVGITSVVLVNFAVAYCLSYI